MLFKNAFLKLQLTGSEITYWRTRMADEQTLEPLDIPEFQLNRCLTLVTFEESIFYLTFICKFKDIHSKSNEK